jgi:2-phosphosulfolactate phosphatase
VVVIDVLRAFTVSAYALASGARECLLVTSVDEALQLQRRLPGSVVSAEVDGLPVPGIAISNSPTLLLRTPLEGRTLVQRTSAGTQAAAAANNADSLLAGSLVVAEATVQEIRRVGPAVLTLVATGEPGGHPEDHACAEYIALRLEDRRPNLAELLRPLRRSERYRQISSGEVPGFPPGDLELALEPDRFHFAMEIAREPSRRLVLRRA